MYSFSSVVEGRNALDDFVFDRAEAIPDDVREKLRALLKERSPVVTCVQAVELVYARREECGAGLVDLAAGLATMCMAFGLGSVGRNERGSRIAAVFYSQLGYMPLSDAPAAGEVPEPDPAYVRSVPEA